MTPLVLVGHGRLMGDLLAINRLAAAMYEPQLVVRDGQVRVPDGPGWGVRIAPAWLEQAERRVSDAPKQ